MSNGVQEYLEGFVYRGRPEGSDQPASWHIEIGRYVEIEGVGRTVLPALQLTPEQARTAGHALPDVLGALNLDALAERDAALAALAAVKAERDALVAQLRAGEKAPGSDNSADQA